MSTVVLSRDDVLFWLRHEADRAIADAETRLTDDRYYVHDGLNTLVTIKAASGDGQKIGRFYKVGESVNHIEWEE